MEGQQADGGGGGRRTKLIMSESLQKTYGAGSLELIERGRHDV
jgi:hypothetical protein